MNQLALGPARRVTRSAAAGRAATVRLATSEAAPQTSIQLIRMVRS
jgi:hypothetical protein